MSYESVVKTLEDVLPELCQIDDQCANLVTEAAAYLRQRAHMLAPAPEPEPETVVKKKTKKKDDGE